MFQPVKKNEKNKAPNFERSLSLQFLVPKMIFGHWTADIDLQINNRSLNRDNRPCSYEVHHNKFNRSTVLKLV